MATNLLPNFCLAPCRHLGTCRILTEFIWSCVATILACMWYTVNRNIPKPPPLPVPKETWTSHCKHWCIEQLETVMLICLALILPEWVLAWAVRQWIVARRLAGELQQAKSEARKPSTFSTSSAGDQVLTMTGATWKYTSSKELCNEKNCKHFLCNEGVCHFTHI